jgi:hypothetical protein
LGDGILILQDVWGGIKDLIKISGFMASKEVWIQFLITFFYWLVSELNIKQGSIYLILLSKI